MQRTPSALMQMVLYSPTLTIDINMDPLIEELKSELRFVFEKIEVEDVLIPGI